MIVANLDVHENLKLLLLPRTRHSFVAAKKKDAIPAQWIKQSSHLL